MTGSLCYPNRYSYLVGNLITATRKPEANKNMLEGYILIWEGGMTLVFDSLLRSLMKICKHIFISFTSPYPRYVLLRKTRGFNPPHATAQKKMTRWSSIFVAEREGFEPSVSCPTLVFKTSTLNHSVTSPRRNSLHLVDLLRKSPWFRCFSFRFAKQLKLGLTNRAPDGGESVSCSLF